MTKLCHLGKMPFIGKHLQLKTHKIRIRYIAYLIIVGHVEQMEITFSMRFVPVENNYSQILH